MQLIDLKYNFVDLTPSEQRAAFFEYYEAREVDLLKPPTYGKKKTSDSTTRKKKGPQVKVSQEQLELLKKLKLV